MGRAGRTGIVADIQIADWLRQHIGDRPVLEEMRGWEHRIVAAYSELLDGYQADPADRLNEIVRVREHPGLIIEQDVTYTSICYHHFLPFHGTMDIAYEPSEVITGIGRIVEMAQAYAHRLQIQEFLVRDVAHALRDRIGAKGVFVRSRALHLCIHSRGPNDTESETVCTYAIGSLAGIDRQIHVCQMLGLRSR
jgi:GTP cyclohydrolase I